MRPAREGKKAAPFCWQHLLAWAGGILCALVPFAGEWEMGAMRTPLRFGPGNFGFNVLIGTGLATAGACLGGYWWRFGNWLQGKESPAFSVSAALLFFLGVSGMASVLFCEGLFSIQPVFFRAVASVLASGVAWAFFSRRGSPGGTWPTLRGLPEWLRGKSRCNVVFYLLLLGLLIIHNAIALQGMEAGLAVKASAFAGRLLTHGLLVGATYLLAELAMRAAPRFLHWTPWLVLGVVPPLVVLDLLLGAIWNRSLLAVGNALTTSGSLEIAVELRASGLEISEAGVWSVVAGVFACAMAMAWACWRLSRRMGARVSPGAGLLFSLSCWLGLLSEQGIGSRWKPLAARQEERRLFSVHLGFFTPPRSVGKYRVEFYPGVAPFSGKMPAAKQKPDVFIFIVESLRADAIRPEVAPFLSRFRDEECQRLGQTWAASNATHLSWFGFFHSRLPVFWRDSLESIPDRDTYAGAVPLQRIRQAGYEIEVRGVCDFDYKDFGLSNFGSGNNLACVLEQSNAGSALEKLSIPEREKVVFKRLRAAVARSAKGGRLYVTALDSPHYNYYWHREFDPPFKSYDEDVRFPFLNPAEDDIQRVLNRYWNSVAWVDHQIGRFCKYLENQGRYNSSIIIVTGDHGEEFQERGGWFHCSSLRPEQVAVPLLIKWPSSIGRGPDRKSASHLDVMPSLMSALGLPGTTIRGLAGTNLLLSGRDEHTAICTTAFAGKNGETMVLRRAGCEAVFFWEKYWEARVPGKIELEYLRAADGRNIRRDTPQAYREELQRLFPDAFERFFRTFEPILRNE